MNNNNIIIWPINNKSLRQSNTLNTAHLTPEKISAFYQKFGLSVDIKLDDISLKEMKKKSSRIGIQS